MKNIVAAGILYFCPKTNKVLLGKRAKDADGNSGEWACFGGKLENGETLRKCALREVEEETGHKETDINALRLNYRSHITRMDLTVVFYCFQRNVPEEFDLPELEKSEHSKSGWFSIDDLPSPLLPAFKNNLKKARVKRISKVGC